jgi:UDP-2,4-diacetamido-2,4,6-trideoxy-beta-L-altropyranose hydrolase
MSLKAVFRTDASILIGTGHVMRCLTLADALASKGAQCTFICREHTGNLLEYIRSKGHAVYSLPIGQSTDADLAHGEWLGATRAEDAQACAPLLAKIQPDWLVVDHYALDARWEREAGKFCANLMVIDDLADRLHVCSLLLDQTFGRETNDYQALVPENCTLLCGSNYALLRPEFADMRPYSLQRREHPQLKRLLITMGGVDKDNVTTQVLNTLRSCPLPDDCSITVVMGTTAPWLADVQQQAKTMPWPTTVGVGVCNMAQLMADSDLAIGAAGATSWERCCLGLPTILVVLAANQAMIAEALSNAGAVIRVEIPELPLCLVQIPVLRGEQTALSLMSHSASQICNGQGTEQITCQIMKDHHENHTSLQ